MTKPQMMLLAVCLLTATYGRAAHDSGRWTVREQESVEKTLALSGQPLRVIVDNVEGYVHVTGSGDPHVRLRAHKVIRAETASDLATARQEVNLVTTEKPGAVSIYYDAPWRCNGNHDSCRGDSRRFYEVSYDIDIEVPRQARIVISTVNNGDIRVENTAGDFDVRDVNGGISMTDVGGSGEAGTVNGPVTVRFAKNPPGACSFKTINGAVDVFLHRDLSADLLFKTFNGQVYADFDVTGAPQAAAIQGERRNGKFVYRSNGFSRARAGGGGPELKFDTLNGDIRLHQADH